MAQWVEVLVTIPDNPSQIPETHVGKKRTDLFLQVVL